MVILHSSLMSKSFDLRLQSFNNALEVLDRPQHVALWKETPPLMFSTKKAEAAEMVASLVETAKNQKVEMSEKHPEETELELTAFILSQAILLWFSDQKQESEAAEVAFSKASWGDLREPQLLSKSQRVIDIASSVINGTKASAAAEYGITAEEVMKLKKERMDFALMVNETGATRLRKALNKGLRTAYAVVEMKFKDLDILIMQFGKTDAGKAMIAAWNDARIGKSPVVSNDTKKRSAPTKRA